MNDVKLTARTNSGRTVTCDSSATAQLTNNEGEIEVSLARSSPFARSRATGHGIDSRWGFDRDEWMCRSRKALARNLSHCAPQFPLCQRQSKVCFKQRSLRRTRLCCRLGAGGGEGRILLELTVGDQGRLSSCLQDFFCHRYEVLHLFNLVIGDLNLYGDLLFRFGETDFRLRKHCARFIDLCIAAPAVKKFVGKYDSKSSEVVHQEWDSALIAISGKSAHIRDVGIFRRRQAGLGFLHGLLGSPYLRTLLACDSDALLARGN